MAFVYISLVVCTRRLISLKKQVATLTQMCIYIYIILFLLEIVMYQATVKCEVSQEKHMHCFNRYLYLRNLIGDTSRHRTTEITRFIWGSIKQMITMVKWNVLQTELEKNFKNLQIMLGRNISNSIGNISNSIGNISLFPNKETLKIFIEPTAKFFRLKFIIFLS